MSAHNFSEGQRLLAAAGSRRKTAAELEVSERAIFGYLAGRRPSDAIQQRMREKLGIPPAAWTQLAGTAIVKAAAEPSGDSPAVAAPAGQPAAPVDDNAVQRLRAQCVRLKAAREAGNLTPRALVEIEQLELRCSAQLARLTTHALSEAQILASAPLQELCERFTAKLRDLDPVGLNLIWQACEPDSTEPIEQWARMRRDHPIEVGACEQANASLHAALTAALRCRESKSESRIPSLGGQRQQPANS